MIEFTKYLEYNYKYFSLGILKLWFHGRAHKFFKCIGKYLWPNTLQLSSSCLLGIVQFFRID